MICKTEAIVFAAFDYGDSSKIVHLYTADHGRRAFLVPAAKRKRMVYFQPFSILEIVYYQKEGRDLQKITESSFHQILPNLTTHPVRLALASLLLEILKATLHEEEPNPPLFQFVIQSFCGLDSLSSGLYAFTMHRLVHVTKFLGFLPLIKANDLTLPVRFLPEEGWIISSETEDAAHRFFLNLLLANETDCLSLRLSKEHRSYFLGLLLRFYQLNTASFPEIRSLAVFEEILS